MKGKILLPTTEDNTVGENTGGSAGTEGVLRQEVTYPFTSTHTHWIVYSQWDLDSVYVQQHINFLGDQPLPTIRWCMSACQAGIALHETD
uniref:Uncharacterized protein n=1 Tax=Sphaerodactylus townsendi TaxID=933632 RepID=A0ACB8FKK9_9SAUR